MNELNHSYHEIDGTEVQWEVMKKSNKRITQCYRCQKWGHTSANCGLPPRCVKCSSTHDQGDCPKVTSESVVSCCNCGGNHSANFRGCPAYHQHLEKMRSRPKKLTSVQPSPQVDSTSQFPSLSSSKHILPDPSPSSNVTKVSFAQTLKESSPNYHNNTASNAININNNVFNKLSQAQNRFASLPNIAESVNLFVSMVEELSNCNDHQGRCMIFVKYCSPFSPDEYGS